MALLAIVGALFVLLFPAACGPFTATNGPATAFRAAAAIQQILLLLCSSLLIAIVKTSVCSTTLSQLHSPLRGEARVLLSLRC